MGLQHSFHSFIHSVKSSWQNATVQ